MSRATDFGAIVVGGFYRSSRPGKSSQVPGGWNRSRRPWAYGFQLSQRADFFEVEVGLETNSQATDDQYFATSRMRTRSTTVACTSSFVTRTSPEIPTYLKMGMTSLVR